MFFEKKILLIKQNKLSVIRKEYKAQDKGDNATCALF